MISSGEHEKTDQHVADASEESDHRTLDSFFDMIPIGFYQFKIIFLLGLANSSDAAEILAMSYINSETGWNDGFLSAAVFAGMLLGGLFAGMLADRLGRKPTLLIGLIMNAVAGVLSAGMPTAGALAAVRFVAGIGIGGTVPSIFTLAAELMPQQKEDFS